MLKTLILKAPVGRGLAAIAGAAPAMTLKRLPDALESGRSRLRYFTANEARLILRHQYFTGRH